MSAKPRSTAASPQPTDQGEVILSPEFRRLLDHLGRLLAAEYVDLLSASPDDDGSGEDGR